MSKEEIEQKLKEKFEEVLKIIQEAEKEYSCKEKVSNELGLTFIINLLSNLRIRYDGDLDLMLKNIRDNCVKLKKVYDINLKI